MDRTRVLLAGLVLAGACGGEPESEALPERRGLILHEEGAFEGYTLFAALRSGVMRLIDMDGNLVHTWPTANSGQAVLLDDGGLMTLGIDSEDHPRFHGPGVGGGLLQELDWDGSVLWSHAVNDEDHQLHHDVNVLPNGNLLFLVREYRSRDEAIAAGRDPAAVDEEGMWPDAIYEIRPLREQGGAEVVWEWHAWDHLVQDHDESKANFGSIRAQPGRIDLNADHRYESPRTEEDLAELRDLHEEMAELGYGGAPEPAPEPATDGANGEGEEEDDLPGTAPDWLHANAVTLHPELDLIVLSAANLSELWVIDHSTTTAEAASSSGGRRGRGGDLLWRWGNPINYGAGELSEQRLDFQHDPTWVPGARPGELRLLVFNNGGGDPDVEASSVDELVLPFEADTGFTRESGKAFGPVEPAWSYRLPEDCHASFLSGARRLPNGNTLICAGPPGRLLEVTRDKRLVWDYENPYPSDKKSEDPDGPPPHAVYRAKRLAPDHPGLAGRTPGGK